MQIVYGKDAAMVESEAKAMFAGARFMRAGPSLSETLQRACSSSLFEPAETCIVANCRFLTGPTLLKADKDAVAGMADLDVSNLVLLGVGDKLTADKTVDKVVIKKAKVKKIPALSERTMGAKIAAYAKKEGFALEESALALFVKRLPPSWGVIEGELAKVAALGLNKVSAGDIDELVTPYEDATVLDWVDAMVGGDAGKAMKLYRRLANEGADEGELVGILAGQLVFIKNAVIAYGSVRSVEGVARALNASPFRVSVHFDLIANTRLETINKMIDQTYANDLLVKEGALTKEACVNALIIAAGAYGRKD